MKDLNKWVIAPDSILRTKTGREKYLLCVHEWIKDNDGLFSCGKCGGLKQIGLNSPKNKFICNGCEEYCDKGLTSISEEMLCLNCVKEEIYLLQFGDNRNNDLNKWFNLLKEEYPHDLKIFKDILKNNLHKSPTIAKNGKGDIKPLPNKVLKEKVLK